VCARPRRGRLFDRRPRNRFLHAQRLLEVLDTYKPVVWEYSRLNITNTVMSKRKLNRLVTDGHVDVGGAGACDGPAGRAGGARRPRALSPLAGLAPCCRALTAAHPLPPANPKPQGWDDPRLLTLAGLRRRGVTPEAVNAFCREIGITR
jgi:glutaminyl-tRNA synthetase